MSNMEGKKVPQVTFRTRQGDQWVDVTTSELFDNKTVVVFSLPGAFTPTCSSSHLPRYNELAPVFKKQDRKSTRLNSSHNNQSRMPSSA